ncbi:uncharacterized protein LOC110059897 [Orbicella faveolata]|uniref:uncharacterized protein LOC110059897 n=1 Tax=Orbicella faveolata TaxID=48498 RepID=UPI0009E38774|nr:uncharacterized protein LOC110059897 [Orbicella faveolata]
MHQQPVNKGSKYTLGALLNLFNKQRAKETRLKVFTFYLISVLFVVSILYALRFALRRARPERVIRILCFGDSLTAGSGRATRRRPHPYSAKLQERFDNHDKTVLDPSIRPIFRVDNAGIPGERAQDEMLPRLYQTLQRARAKYSWVIILGGTNDLRKYRENAASFDIEDSKLIFHALVNLHNISHTFGAKTVAVSVPDRECEGSGTCFYLKEIHLKINELLKEFSSRNNEKVILADLASEVFLPRDKRLWGDPIHFNKQGYDKMADVIYNSMKEHV